MDDETRATTSAAATHAATAHREIGGYIEFERYSGSVYHDGAVALDCGRSCLEYLIDARGIRTIWLPDFMCESVRGRCERCGVSVRTYAIGGDLRPVYDFAPAAGEYLYLCDYYGQLGEADVRRALAFASGRVIVDEAQCYFKRPVAGVDTLYTSRKFLGVADGAYLYTDAEAARTYPRDESFDRMRFLLGRFERTASEFYGEYRANNDYFEDQPAKRISLLTENILASLDYARIMRTREENFAFLHKALAARNELARGEAKLVSPPGPFAYPLLVRGGCELRRALAQEEKIYVPTLWPNVVEEAPEGSAAHRFACDILPLPVDQRYGRADMRRIVDALVSRMG